MHPTLSKRLASRPAFLALLTFALSWLATLSFSTGVQASHPELFDRPASSTQDRLGLGLMLGAPTGLNAKFRFNRRDGMDFGLAFSFNSYVETYADYLYHFSSFTISGTHHSAEFTPYLGVGGVLFGNTTRENAPGGAVFDSSTAIGVRVPIGLEWLSHRMPLGAFGELAPGVGLIPGTFGFLEGDVGARFYF